MTKQPSTMTALKSKTKSLTKLKIRRKLRKINLPKEIRYIEANTVFIFYGNQLTVNLKLVNNIKLFKTSKILTFFGSFLPFDSKLVDIPCIVSGIGSILLFYPLTYTLDLFAAALHVQVYQRVRVKKLTIQVKKIVAIEKKCLLDRIGAKVETLKNNRK